MDTKQAEKFYRHVLDVLKKSAIPFMVGGTYAFNAYTGITRETKDIDLITTKANCKRILSLFKKEGYATELLDPVWIGKIYHNDNFVDVIFAERNGIYKVKNSWFELARSGKVLGRKVDLMPLEFMISTKIYVKFREKYDGSDINYLLLQYAKKINWHVLTRQVATHWQLLFSHLLMFAFVFPSEKNAIPPWVIKNYLKKTQDYFSQPPLNLHITRGHLISYEYSWAIDKWDYKPVMS